jgi:hypothetical protein
MSEGRNELLELLALARGEDAFIFADEADSLLLGISIALQAIETGISVAILRRDLEELSSAVKATIEQQSGCRHKWTDARNDVIEAGEICLKCHAVRA